MTSLSCFCCFRESNTLEMHIRNVSQAKCKNSEPFWSGIWANHEKEPQVHIHVHSLPQKQASLGKVLTFFFFFFGCIKCGIKMTKLDKSQNVEI